MAIEQKEREIGKKLESLRARKRPDNKGSSGKPMKGPASGKTSQKNRGKSPTKQKPKEKKTKTTRREAEVHEDEEDSFKMEGETSDSSFDKLKGEQ